MKRELPIFKINGTDFLVDVAKLELHEKANPENSISFFEMLDVRNGYVFEYSSKYKNQLPLFEDDAGSITIHVPQLVELDPEGMAEKYGKTKEELQGKSDLEIMIDQSVLQQRLNGRLTTVDIVGHTFYVDIRMDKLRPKDDFLSKGIVFSEVDHYYFDERAAYTIPYNPSTHEFKEIDFDTLTRFPEELIVIEFPHERMMDPVGVNRKGGWDDTFELKETSIQEHFIAKIIEWKDTGLEETIKANLEKLSPKQQEQANLTNKNNQRLQRGRGIS